MSSLVGSPHTLIVSTLGAPGRPVVDVARIAQGAGAGGLEVRTAAGQEVAPGTASVDLARVRSGCERLGQPIVTVASYLRVAEVDPHDGASALQRAGGGRDPFMDAAAEHCRIARLLGARCLRVFPGGPVLEGPKDRDPVLAAPVDVLDEVAVRRLVALASMAADYGVSVALETHDSHPRGRDVARLLSQVDRRCGVPVGAIWDVLHPWRVGESFAETWRQLAAFLAPRGPGYLQIKDVVSPADCTPMLPGRGAIDLAAWWQVVGEGGFGGPLALEWERAWYPSIPSLTVALAAVRDWGRRQGRTADQR